MNLILLLLSHLQVVQLFEDGRTRTDVVLSVLELVDVLDGVSVQGEDEPDAVGQSNLVTHDAGQMLQQSIECPELFTAHSNYSTFEKLVRVDEESHFSRLPLGHLDQ